MITTFWLEVVNWVAIIVGIIWLTFLLGLLVFFLTGMFYDMWKGGPEARARWAEARKAVAAGWVPPTRRPKTRQPEKK